MSSRQPITSAVPRRHAGIVALTVLSLVWLGLLLGVSFLATPVKFLAPSLTLPVALDVGRYTFAWLSRVELVLGVAILSAAIAQNPKAWATWVAGLLLAIVAGQFFWLLPLLDARVEIILQGDVPPPSSLHVAYIFAEVAKLAALLALAVYALSGRQFTQTSDDAAFR